MVGIMQIDSVKSRDVAGREKNVLCSDWKGEYVQGQSWTVVVGLSQLLNFLFISVKQHGGSGGGLPLWTSQFDTLKVQNIFSFMDIALAITLECDWVTACG